MTKQETNIKAARLCGYHRQAGTSLFVTDEDDDDPPWILWDIFADTPQGAWCREQVVKALEKDHRILIMWLPGTKWNFSGGQGKGGTYPEAIAAAVEHIEVKP